MHLVKVLDLPYGKFRDKGTPIDNVSNYVSAQEQILFAGSLETVKKSNLLFAAASGMLKQVEGLEFDVSKRTIASTKLAEGDRLVLVGIADESDYVVLQSKNGFFLRFLKEEVPVKKKTAVAEGDELAHAYLLESRMEYEIEYREKKMSLNKLKLSKRDTKGTKVRV